MPPPAGAPSVDDMLLTNRSAAVVLTLGLAVGMSGCGGEPEVCADVDALRADLDDVTAIELQPGSLAEFSTALDEVEADVDQIMSSAASEFDSEIEALRTATQALKASVETATQAPSGPAVTEVSAAFGAFTDAADTMQEAVVSTC
jgi:hypothetical protein